MHNRIRFLIPLFAFLLLIILAVWYLTRERNAPAEGLLQASGTVEAVEVVISPELAGRVVEVLVEKGDEVEAGDLLFRLDDDLMQAQLHRALAAFEVAQDGVESAESGLEIAQAGLLATQAALKSAQINLDVARLQLRITLDAARQAEQPDREGAWSVESPDEFSLPVFYFDKHEEIAAAEAEVATASQALEVERANLNAVIQKASNADMRAAEGRLSKAQAAFLVAQAVLERAEDQDNEDLQNFAQSLLDTAQSELEAAQSAYDNMLTEAATDEILEARARLSVAQERYDTARDRLNTLFSGEEALQVQAAELVVRQADATIEQAQSGVAQAEAAVKQAGTRLAQSKSMVNQAQAELELNEVQLENLKVYSAVAGVVITRNIEPGEVVQPGSTALSIGQLANLTITVYVPEDRYGEIRLGSHATVSVDSFPGKIFDATVARISDKAEFTPRNVQTEEGRRTTVFAIELAVDDPNGDLKPGMPADVKFGN